MKRSNYNKTIARSGVLVFFFAMLLAIAAPVSGEVMLTPERVGAALQRHAVKHGPWKAENVEVRVLHFQPVSLPAGAIEPACSSAPKRFFTRPAKLSHCRRKRRKGARTALGQS